MVSLENFSDMLSYAIGLRDKYYKISGQISIEKEDCSITVDKYIIDRISYHLDDNGVYCLQNIPSNLQNIPPSLCTYNKDYEELSSIISNGPLKSFCFRRLRCLDAEFQLYLLVNEGLELTEQKDVPHRDFYNVRKVDTHVHHSSCMNCKHLLRFVKGKLKTSGSDVVMKIGEEEMTLEKVFDDLNLKAYDLSVDVFDMHAHQDSFHRFDRFSSKYNPIGEGSLREIFLKFDNHIKGKYLAEITSEIIEDLEESKYQMVEWRVSIYGQKIGEWDILSSWISDNNLKSKNVKWLIQIPRLYDQFRAADKVKNFHEYLRNIFEPLFEITVNPSKNAQLHEFLKDVVGFDCVDDESKPEKTQFVHEISPKDWEVEENPLYSYYIYHIYANICVLNNLRRLKGQNTFVFRPHCGEAGDPFHSVDSFLLAHGINHGITLRKVPTLQYLFYLCQIGIAMSPISNNVLFLKYDRNPFIFYFNCGMNVSLSTDDPLQFHFTKEPLIEEYSVAAQIYKFSSADMCEIARNSVIQSGFSSSQKEQWLGSKDWSKVNNVQCTNVPSSRIKHRMEALRKERELNISSEAYTNSVSSKEVLMLRELEDGSCSSIEDSM